MSNRTLRRLRSAVLLVASLAPPLAAGPQGLPSPLAPANPAPLVYCPPERLSAGKPHPNHVLDVFLPLGQPPAGGWPVVVTTGYGGGASVPPTGALASTGASAPLWRLVEAGIAVVSFGTPGIGGNRGLWYPPGHPSGRYESFRPADDNPEKSAEWALQWVKVQTLYPFDLEHVGLRGSSGGAVLAIRTAMGPDRARATGSAQVRASTRVAAILAIQPPTSAWALAQGPELTIPFPKHLEKAAQPGVAAATLSEVSEELQKDYSLMRTAFESPEARANNVQQPLCLVFGDPVLRIDGAVASFDEDAGGFPVVHDAILQPRQHDSWFGYVFWKHLLGLSPESAAFHAAHSMFAIRDTSALAPPLDLHTRTFRGTVSGAAATRLGHDWLVGRLLAKPLAAHAPDVHALPVTGGGHAPRATLDSLALEPGPGASWRWTVALRGEPFAPACITAGALPWRCAELDATGRAELVLDVPASLVDGGGLVLRALGRGWTSGALELAFPAGPR